MVWSTHLTLRLLLMLAFVACSSGVSTNENAVEDYFQVTKVVDGDTFGLMMDRRRDGRSG